jgi:hypothetical protein
MSPVPVGGSVPGSDQAIGSDQSIRLTVAAGLRRLGITEEVIVTTTIHVTDDTTRAELAEAITHLSHEAERIRRRGYIGTRSQDYERQHGRINALLDDLERAKA